MESGVIFSKPLWVESDGEFLHALWIYFPAEHKREHFTLGPFICVRSTANIAQVAKILHHKKENTPFLSLPWPSNLHLIHHGGESSAEFTWLTEIFISKLQFDFFFSRDFSLLNSCFKSLCWLLFLLSCFFVVSDNSFSRLFISFLIILSTFRNILLNYLGFHLIHL